MSLNWSVCREIRWKTAGDKFVDRIHNGFDKLKFTLKFGNLDGYKFHVQGMSKGRKVWVGRWRLQFWRDKDFKFLRDWSVKKKKKRVFIPLHGFEAMNVGTVLSKKNFK